MTQNCNCNCNCTPSKPINVPVTSINLPTCGLSLNIDGANLCPGGQTGEGLTDNLVLYVATTGDDANDGFTPGTAMATVHRAVKYLQTVRYNGFGATVNVADGEYEGGRLALHFLSGWTDIVGESQQNTVLRFPVSTRFASVSIKNLRIHNEQAHATVLAMSCQLYLENIGIHIENKSYDGIRSAEGGCAVYLRGDIDFSGKARSFVSAIGSAHLGFDLGVNVVMNGEVDVATAYACWGGTLNSHANPISGTVTGRKYLAECGGLIKADSAFPGSAAGTTTTGGQYYS